VQERALMSEKDCEDDWDRIEKKKSIVGDTRLSFLQTTALGRSVKKTRFVFFN